MKDRVNSIKRRLVEHFATLVNELHIGSDGTQASADDGGVRSLAKVTPKVVIIDDQTILVEGTFGKRNLEHCVCTCICICPSNV